MTDHLLNQAGVHTMRELYDRLGLIPTSTAADTVLVRSHVAYWAGQAEAARVDIRPARGHSYRFVSHGIKYVVKISDHYDHRNGVTGWTASDPVTGGGR